MEAQLNQYIPYILIMIGYIILTVIFNRGFKYIRKWLEYKNNELEVKKFDIETHIEITDTIDTKLENIIESAFQEYSLLNLVYKTDWYITDDEETKIVRDVSHLVADRLSPVFLHQIALYYNEDAITDIIAKRVYFRVVTFRIDHNKNTGF